MWQIEAASSIMVLVAFLELNLSGLIEFMKLLNWKDCIVCDFPTAFSEPNQSTCWRHYTKCFGGF